jgi:hypothetical protein
MSNELADMWCAACQRLLHTTGRLGVSLCVCTNAEITAIPRGRPHLLVIGQTFEMTFIWKLTISG